MNSEEKIISAVPEGAAGQPAPEQPAPEQPAPEQPAPQQPAPAPEFTRTVPPRTESYYSPYYTGRPAPAPAPKPKRAFAAYEIAFAWVTLFLSYLFCRVSPAEDNPLGALLFTLLLFGCGALFVILRRSEVSGYSVAVAASAVIFSLSFFLSSNAVLHICSFLWICCAYIYWIYCACGNSIAPLGEVTFGDVFKSLFVMPWSSLGAFPRALFGSGKSESGKKAGKSVLWILLGLCAAILPTSIVLSLLSYDDRFNALMDRIFSFDISVIMSHIGSLILAVPIAFMGFAYLIGSSDHRHRDRMTAEGCRKTGGAVKVLPQLLVYFTILPMLLVYVLFFVSQWEYYLAAFGGKLPEGTSLYSNYAREGFFELCSVSAINAFALLMMALFTRRAKKETPDVFQRIFAGILSVFTLILIATAASKMILYIRILGLTPKRVYTMWFMLLLACAFIYALIRQIVPKFNFTAFFLVTFVVLYAVLALGNVDGFIARYNADRYIDGSLEEYDAEAMADLGDSALPQMIRVAEYMVSSGRVDPKGIGIREAIALNESELSLYDRRVKEEEWKKTLSGDAASEQYYELIIRISEWHDRNEKEENGVFSLTLPKIRAEAALRDALAE